MIEFDFDLGLVDFEMKRDTGQSSRDQQALRRWENNVVGPIPGMTDVYRPPLNPTRPSGMPQTPATPSKGSRGAPPSKSSG